MTFEPNIKCIWQHPATKNHLEMTKIEWSETDQTICYNSKQSQTTTTWNLEAANQTRKSSIDETPSSLTRILSLLKIQQNSTSNQLSREGTSRTLPIFGRGRPGNKIKTTES